MRIHPWHKHHISNDGAPWFADAHWDVWESFKTEAMFFLAISMKQHWVTRSANNQLESAPSSSPADIVTTKASNKAPSNKLLESLYAMTLECQGFNVAHENLKIKYILDEVLFRNSLMITKLDAFFYDRCFVGWK